MSWRGSGTSGIESTAPGPDAGPPTPTTPFQRAAGLAAIVGALLWPVALVTMATADLSACTNGAACIVSGSTFAPLALSTVLLTVGLAGMELHAPGEFGLLDPIGDLSIGTAAGLFSLSAVTSSFGLVAPGFFLLAIGSLIFGIRGWNGRRRARFGSILIVAAIATEVVFVALGTTIGTAAIGGFETPALFGLLLYAIGWAWLGAHLALGRPLVPAPYREDPTYKRPARPKADRDR